MTTLLRRMKEILKMNEILMMNLMTNPTTKLVMDQMMKNLEVCNHNYYNVSFILLNIDNADSESKKSTSGKRIKKKSRPQKKDREYGVSRGVDFINVAAVINFDFPTSAKSYTHR